MREKLIDVFCAVLGVSEDHKTDEAYQFIDDLIANGVVVSKMETTTDKDTNVPSKWIPVTERLPDDLIDVLTYDGKGHFHVFWHHHEFEHPFNIGKNHLRYYPVTHWMPLPQPPKGE